MNKKYKTLMIIFIVLAIAINVFIIVEAAMSGEDSGNQSGWLADIIAKMFNITPDENFHHLVRKLIGHFSLYVVDGVITSLAEYYLIKYREMYKYRLIIIIYLGSGVFLASFSEFVQLLALNRGFAVTDMLINFSGYFVGALIIFLIGFFSNVKSQKKHT